MFSRASVFVLRGSGVGNITFHGIGHIEGGTSAEDIPNPPANDMWWSSLETDLFKFIHLGTLSPLNPVLTPRGDY